jgi:sugar phosphate isomerase/epimerase
MELKGKFTFRLGAASYTIPGDILANVNLLCDLVDDIEIVLFESDEIAPLPDLNAISTLNRLALVNDLTYTVHLPLDIWIGDSNESERRASVDKCLRVFERTSPLNPFAFVLHCSRCDRNGGINENIAHWKENVTQSVLELISEGVSPEMLCVETLDYPFDLLADIVYGNKLSMCLDIGHIALHGYPLQNYLNDYFAITRTIHVHGVIQGKDHKNISLAGAENLRRIISLLNSDSSNQRVLTMEVFSKPDLDKSLRCMEQFLS